MFNQLIAHADEVWTEERLAACFWAWHQDEQVIVLANREPFSHETDADGRTLVTHSHAGVVTAVEPLLRACSGVWVAHGSGSADRIAVRERDGLDVPPHNPAYRLRRVWLSDDEQKGYYEGFANEALWPLCHRAHVRPVFRPDDFTTYWAVNARFAEAVCREARTDSPLVLVQDYHFALAPLIIRERLPLSTVISFWHIPWPSRQTLEICPWRQYLLNGLLGSDIVGFQTPADSRNFLDSVEQSLEAHIDREDSSVTYGGRRVHVRVYPASIEWPDGRAAQSPPVAVCRADVRRQLQLPPQAQLGLGVDRLDYTKGLDEKFAVIEWLLQCNPEFRKRFVFVQIAAPTRERLAAYRELRSRVQAAADRINQRFGAADCTPIVLLMEQHDPADVYRFMRAADVCYVGSLHDGMNLVSKEFVGARDDEGGVLMLSAFAGAARELPEALIVNPYDTTEAAQALADALTMSDVEQRGRMRRLRARLAESNAYRWAAQMLSDAAHLRHERQRWEAAALQY